MGHVVYHTDRSFTDYNPRALQQWADFYFATISRHRVSDRLEKMNRSRAFTMDAVVFGTHHDRVVIRPHDDGPPVELSVPDVQLPGARDRTQYPHQLTTHAP